LTAVHDRTLVFPKMQLVWYLIMDDDDDDDNEIKVYSN
jgi:hypothetical protein